MVMNSRQAQKGSLKRWHVFVLGVVVIVMLVNRRQKLNYGGQEK